MRIWANGNGDTNDYFAMQLQGFPALPEPLYGTTFWGGDAGYGTIFTVVFSNEETVLYSFSNSPYGDGANPIGDLVLSNNTLYGVTEAGGANGDGAIFSYNIGSSTDQVLHSFNDVPDGKLPLAGLVLSGNTLYGTTSQGGQGGGTIFSINTNGSNYMSLYTNDDLINPEAPLLLISDTLYGTTSHGGSYGDGTIFSVCTNGSNYLTLYAFGATNTDGWYPAAGLTLVSNKLYGTTENDAVDHDGAIFSLAIGSSNDVVLHNFTDKPDGKDPRAGLALFGNKLYGTTYAGGANSVGTAFSIDVGSGNYTSFLSFGASDSYFGQFPQADLTAMSNVLYGTTYQGGTNNGGNGMIFSISTNEAGLGNVYDFVNKPDGANPYGGLCSP